MTSDLELALACEQRIVNAWPAQDTLLLPGWVVRFAAGYSGRANSASAIAAGAALSDADFELIEGLYRAAGLPPCVRLTPLIEPATAARIERRGYRLKDASLGMIAEACAVAVGPAVEIAPHADAAWVRGVSARQTGTKKDADAALAAIVSRIRLPAAFATLRLDGRAVGYGMTVVERGMAEIGAIVIDEAVRGQGLGRQLVGGLMAWAAGNGASKAYLQVEQGNAPALALYARLGFRELYRYRTLIL